MGTCKDCKYWWKYPVEYYSECEKLSNNRERNALEVVIEDYSFSHYINTSGDFGCTLFEEKEAEE